jgi:hypothetical protein
MWHDLILKVIALRDMTSYKWVYSYRYQNFTVCCCPPLQGNSLFWTHVTIYKESYKKDGKSIIAPRNSCSHLVFFFLAYTKSKNVFITVKLRIWTPSKYLCNTRCISIFESAKVLKFEFHNIVDVGDHQWMCAFIRNSFLQVPSFLQRNKVILHDDDNDYDLTTVTYNTSITRKMCLQN